MIGRFDRRFDGDPADREVVAVPIVDRAKILHPSEIGLLERRVSHQVADDAAVGQHPIFGFRNQSAFGRAAAVRVLPDHIAVVTATLQVATVSQLAKVMSRVEGLKDVISVQRDLG